MLKVVNMVAGQWEDTAIIKDHLEVRVNNPTLFETKEEAQVAIDKSVAYYTKKKALNRLSFKIKKG